MSIVVIGERERRLIARAKENAAKRPVPIGPLAKNRFPDDAKTFMLKDRPANYNPDELPPVHSVDIPYGYRASYSIEEQPAGMAAHLSVGTEGRKRKGMVPNKHCVQMIAEEFGIPFPPNGAMWIEEWSPGEYAINLVHILNPREEGNA